MTRRILFKKITDKLLFTQGPLNTRKKGKEAALRDLGSREAEFINVVREIREKLLKLAGVSKEVGYECIIMQGSGTYSIESVISSVITERDHLLLLVNGAYGDRIYRIAEVYKIRTTVMSYSEDKAPSITELEEKLQSEKTITHVAAVHCETTSGIFNPIGEIGTICGKYNKTYLVDATSSFGAVPVDLIDMKIDFLVSSSNKCIQGIPGFAFIISRKSKILEAKGKARTISLDMYSQWSGLERNGQFRFTPPLQALVAFKQALDEIQKEGSVEARAARYEKHSSILFTGMDNLGFVPYLKPENRGYIITSFYYPEHPLFDFERFYTLLNNKGFVIYPGKVTQANSFRIGNIGNLTAEDISKLLIAIEEVLKEMNIYPLVSINDEPGLSSSN